MKRLSTKDILQGLISDPYAKRYFLGVFPRDKVPRITKYPSSLIVNTDKQGERGEHWLAIYVDKYKNCEFFDSFGLSEKDYGFDGYIRTFSRNYTSNKLQMQDISSNACGYYCIYFILFKSRGLSLNEIQNLFSRDNFNFNDFLVCFIV